MLFINNVNGFDSLIPREDVVKRFTIYKNSSSNNVQWYEKYRIDEKEYNDAYHNLDDEDLKFVRKN